MEVVERSKCSIRLLWCPFYVYTVHGTSLCVTNHTCTSRRPRPLRRARLCRQYFRKYGAPAGSCIQTDGSNDLRYRGMTVKGPWRACFQYGAREGHGRTKSSRSGCAWCCGHYSYGSMAVKLLHLAHITVKVRIIVLVEGPLFVG